MELFKAGFSEKTKIKICGITSEEEAVYLNEAGADYAGFVFYPPSKRNISLEIAKDISKLLSPTIKCVAVTVSPNPELVQKIINGGFDVIQIHGKLDRELIKQITIPIWYAVNVSRAEDVEKAENHIKSLPTDLGSKIEGIVIDGAGFGSGKTFDWNRENQRWRVNDIFENRKFILAGGLTVENVMTGIETFKPDIVDVSSGVEIKSVESFRGKDPDKIKAFCKQVALATKEF